MATHANRAEIPRTTMKRLRGFDYTKPYFYMITLKRVKGLCPFCRIPESGRIPKDEQGREVYLFPNELTKAFAHEIQTFHTRWRGIWPIDCFIIMPDHIHLLIHLKDDEEERLSLGRYIYQLMKALTIIYWNHQPEPIRPSPSAYPPIFEHDWHDWIVKKSSQLAAFDRYIHENPMRSWLRQRNRPYFQTVRTVSFLGREWFAYGNTAILDLPILKAVKGHRATRPASDEWQQLIDECSRLGPTGAGVGTFMSPLEKACGNTIAMTGGKLVVLCPEGFHNRWHPGRKAEKYCAEGRMLFLSLYPPLNRLPTKAELYTRCHEMGDIVVQGLS